LLTNKPVRISHVIVDGLGLSSTFFRIYGGNSFEQKKPHPIGIQKLMEETGASGHRTLMVGDSKVDIETARNAGSRSCGVLYGFQPETFALVPPDFLVREAVEILAL
jgi:phosphoglycolate phosphatase